MIRYYTCKNFYSIGKDIKVDFEVNQKAPKSDTYTKEDERVSLIEAIVGPNASGKTNVIKALAFIRHLIVESGSKDADEPIHVVTFQSKDTPTELSVKFDAGKRTFLYDFVLTQDMILSEKLRERTKTEQRVTYKTLFSRSWNEEAQNYSFIDKVFGLPSIIQSSTQFKLDISSFSA